MKIRATPVFHKNWNSKKKITINRGWTRSSKTFSILQLCLVWLITGRVDDDKHFDNWILTIVRKEKTTLKATAIRDWEEIISESWCDFLLSDQHRNLTDKVYKYDWRVVEFIWADDQQKLRWGKRDILYCNEANSLSYDQEFFQLFIRTTYKTFIDFNPDNDDVWINTELEQKRQYEEWDVEVIVSTYKDNPFLPDQMVKEIERLERVNPQYWKIYWLWEYWKLEWVIFNNRRICDDIPKEAKLVARWLDFWYTNDPTAYIEIYKWVNTIFIDELIYETWLTNLDIDSKVTSMWIDKWELTIADSAEPKSIEELYRNRWYIKPAQKWPDSITYWISLMQQYNIAITARSKNTIREFKSYCWATDKNWKLINKPAPWLDHAIDGIRYVFMDQLDRQPQEKQKPFQISRY